MGTSRNACWRAYYMLMNHKQTPQSNHLPYRSPYFPRDSIIEALRSFPVKNIFLCECDECIAFTKPLSLLEREDSFSEDDLLGQYAEIYALLIFVRCAGLIYLFRRYQRSLKGGAFGKDNLAFLIDFATKNPTVLTPEQAEVIRGNILENQYSFKITVLERKNEITVLDEREILPIIEEKDPVGGGDFGEVYAFSFPDHSKKYVSKELRDSQITRFARKIFNEHASAAKEWVNLLHASRFQHDHLMSALAAFEHGKYFFIVFQRAECSLRDLLKMDHNMFGSSEVLWQQVHGITSALAYLHSTTPTATNWSYGGMLHMDLKPANVLIVGGCLKIADFGLSWKRPSSDNGGSGSKSTRLRGESMYAPPVKGSYNDKYDVYSLGAMFSEIACFDVGSKRPSRVEQFRSKRMADVLRESSYPSFHFYYQDTEILKQSVVHEHADLLDLARGRGDTSEGNVHGQWMKSFYVPEVFQLIESMLNESPEDRPSAAFIAGRLQSFIDEAHTAMRKSQGSDVITNVWQETEEGVADSGGLVPEHRFCARFRNIDCGFWLYPNPRGSELGLRRFHNDWGKGFPRFREEYLDNLYSSRRSVSIKLDFVKDVHDQTITIQGDRGWLNASYTFRVIEDAIKFQSVLLRKLDIYEHRSFELTGFSLNNYPPWFSRRPPNKEEVAERAQLQIWTNCNYLGPGTTDAAISITIAIVSFTRLHQFLVLDPIKRQVSTLPSNTLRLRLKRVQYLSTDITGGIQLRVPTPDGRNPHDEVECFLQNAKDLIVFWTALIELQNRRIRAEPRSSDPEVLPRWAPAQT